MYLYTQILLQSSDTPVERVLSPIGIRVEDIVFWRAFIDEDSMPKKYRRHSALTLRSGGEVPVVATFKQIKDLLDPNSDGGTLVESIDPDPPHLDFSL